MSALSNLGNATDKTPTDFVVVFGQMRDDYACLEKIYQFYSDRPNTKIILTTWLAKGKKVDGLYGPSQLRLVFGDEVARSIPYHVQGSKFYSFYPGLRELMALQGDQVISQEVSLKFPDAHIDIEEEVFNLDFTQPKGDLNSKRLLYKWWRGVRLIDHFCKSENLAPRKVMLIRTDRMPANPGILDLELESNDLYLDKWAETTAGDMLLVSTYQNIRSVANLFNLCELEPERPWGGIHREMNQRIRDLGLNPISTSELCDVRNFNKIGVFEEIARSYLSDPVNHCHQHVAYSNTFLNAIRHARLNELVQMQACLKILEDADFKQDVSLWLCRYFCAYYLNDFQWALQSVCIAILVAVRNSIAFLKKEMLRPNDTYLISMFIHVYRKQYGVDNVFESSNFSSNFSAIISSIEMDYSKNPVVFTEKEKNPLNFISLAKEIYK